MARNRKRAKERQARRPQTAAVAAGRPREEEEAPEPLEHAAPDVELAEAQLAIGRPTDGAVDEQEFETEAGESQAGEEEADEVAERLPARREPIVRRLVEFLQGSWRELQRVQWPDRRQVMQATGVVIGFVIIAGVFLGVADFLAGKIMNYVLTGHFK